MERVIYKHIYNYILEHSLLYAYQSGFLKGHSTVYQLLEIYHNACQNLDKRLSTIIIFLLSIWVVQFPSDGSVTPKCL
jgi:hypothetical protein